MLASCSQHLLSYFRSLPASCASCYAYYACYTYQGVGGTTNLGGATHPRRLAGRGQRHLADTYYTYYPLLTSGSTSGDMGDMPPARALVLLEASSALRAEAAVDT